MSTKSVAKLSAGDEAFAAVSKALKGIIQADFSNVRILEVSMHRPEFADEDVVTIEVVFEGAPKDLDSKKLAGSIRAVRPTLREGGIESFPLMNFVTKGDAGVRKFAPA